MLRITLKVTEHLSDALNRSLVRNYEAIRGDVLLLRKAPSPIVNRAFHLVVEMAPKKSGAVTLNLAKWSIMQKVRMVIFCCGIFASACDAPSHGVAPKVAEKPASPRSTIDPTWPPSSSEFYSSDYPQTPDVDAESAPGDPVSAGFTCPDIINGAMIPGNVYPYHKVFIGRDVTLEFLHRVAILGYSNTGIPKASYAIPHGPWVSDDGAIAVMLGTVSGWCRFTEHPPFGIWGTLNVFDAEVQIIGNLGSGSGTQPCDYAAIVYDPTNHTASCPASGGGGGGGSGGGSGSDCTWEYITIEIDYGRGAGWELYWQGSGWWCGEETA